MPVVLVMLIVLALAGMLAARRSATVQDIGNNHRMSQVAHTAAQSALRFCESVVIDMVEVGNNHAAADIARVVTSPELPDAEDASARWAVQSNWAPGAANLIEVPRQQADASAALNTAAAPFCIAEALSGGRYLITARGLSAGAEVSADGSLAGHAGSEAWLQAILSPDVPVRSTTGAGYE